MAKEVKTVEATTEVKTKSVEDILAPKTDKVKTNGKRLGLYLVLLDEDAVIVKAALDKVGEKNYAAYIRRLVLADLKSRLNGAK